MTAYSFNKQFIGPMLAGIKCQTIRPIGKRRHARVGAELQLYTAMRTKYCRLIGRATCVSCCNVVLDFPDNSVTIYGVRWTGWENLEPFARSDGFDGWLMMREFWREHHADKPVFAGVLIRWGGFRPADSPP